MLFESAFGAASAGSRRNDAAAGTMRIFTDWPKIANNVLYCKQLLAWVDAPPAHSLKTPMSPNDSTA
jgi:hypothetical protein